MCFTWFSIFSGFIFPCFFLLFWNTIIFLPTSPFIFVFRVYYNFLYLSLILPTFQFSHFHFFLTVSISNPSRSQSFSISHYLIFLQFLIFYAIMEFSPNSATVRMILDKIENLEASTHQYNPKFKKYLDKPSIAHVVAACSYVHIVQ